MLEYVHYPLPTEVKAIGGYYVLQSERELSLEGKRLLYLSGYGVVDSSCCGTGGCQYIYVPGFIAHTRVKEDSAGNPVSLIEPVLDDDLRQRVRDALYRQEGVSQVVFREGDV